MQVNSVGETSTQWREAFRTAGHWFATTSRVAPDQLDQPALGVWNVRDLLGHTSRALSTVSTYLATEAAGGIGVESAVDYFRLALRQAAPEELACALSEPLNPPAPAAASALRLAVALGTDKGAAGDLLLGLTGRRNVPAGFSVL
jgi:hypothetical protein